MTGRALIAHLLSLHDAGLPLPAIGGGAPEDGEATTGGTTAAQGAAAAAPAAPAAPPDLVAEFQSLKTELLAFKAEKAARDEQARLQAQQELIKKGQLDEIAKNHAAALKAKDDALAAIDSRVRKAELSRSLTEALSGHDLREGALGQLMKLWGDEFQVDDDGDGFKVRCKADLRDPKAVFAERLASKEYDHFLKAGHRGGSGAGSAQGAKPAEASQQQLSPFAYIAQQMKAKYQGGQS